MFRRATAFGPYFSVERQPHILASPDIPSVLFWILTVWALVELQRSQKGIWWLAVGLFAGCGLLSKYANVFFRCEHSYLAGRCSEQYQMASEHVAMDSRLDRHVASDRDLGHLRHSGRGQRPSRPITPEVDFLSTSPDQCLTRRSNASRSEAQIYYGCPIDGSFLYCSLHSQALCYVYGGAPKCNQAIRSRRVRRQNLLEI